MLTPRVAVTGRTLTKQEVRWFNATIQSSHHARTHVEMWNRDRELVGPVNFVIDGQVDIDGTSRTCICQIADPDDHWKLGTNLTFLDRILRVERHIDVPEMDEMVAVPIFTGPVVKADENGHVITLEAHGMELWLQGAVKLVHRWPKGAFVTSVQTQMLTMAGVQNKHMNIPHRPDRLPAAFQIGPQYDGGFDAATKYLASTINCDLFPDGAGNFQQRHRPGQLVWSWTGDEDGSIISQPQKSTLIGGADGGDATTVINDVIVFGVHKPVKPPKDPPPGWKPPELPVIRGEAIAKDGSRFAPGSLGFTQGPGLYLLERTTLEHVRLNRTADRIAGMMLHRRLSVAVTDSFDCVVVPHLDPFDRCKIDVTGRAGTFYFLKASIPFNFTESTPMTVGYSRLIHVPMEGKHHP